MDNSINVTILTGWLKADPDIRYTKEEKAVAHFTILSKGEPFDCVAFDGLAKIVGEYLKEGRLVAVEGKIQIDIQGKTTIKVDNLQFLDNKYFKEGKL